MEPLGLSEQLCREGWQLKPHLEGSTDMSLSTRDVASYFGFYHSTHLRPLGPINDNFWTLFGHLSEVENSLYDTMPAGTAVQIFEIKDVLWTCPQNTLCFRMTSLLHPSSRTAILFSDKKEAIPVREKKTFEKCLLPGGKNL